MTSALILVADTSAGLICLTDGDALVVSHPTRATIDALPGLSVETEIDLLLSTGDESAPRQIRVSLSTLEVLPWDLIGIAELHLATPIGDEVSISDRTLIARGWLDEIAADGLTLSATLRDDPLDDRGQILDPGATVRPQTWPRTDAQRAADLEPAFVGTPASQPQIEGASYPVLIGRPGQAIPYRVTGVGLITTAAPAAPALLCETSDSATVLSDHRLIVSAGRIDAATVQRVSVDQTGAPTIETCTVEVGHDREGRVVSLISPGSALDIPGEDAESWICLPSGAGIRDPYGDGPLRRADHVIRWALDRSTLRLDRRQIPRLSALRAYQIDTAVYSPAGAWAWLSSQVLPYLPVSISVGPAGLYLWPHLSSWSRQSAGRRLEVGLDCERVGPAVGAQLALTSRVTVRYAVDARSGDYRRSVTLAGRRETHDGPEVLLDQWARRAAQLAPPGSPRAVTIDCPCTADPVTAVAIAQDTIRRACRPSAVVELVVDAETAADLLPGDVIDLVDPTLPTASNGTLATAAQIERVRYTAGAALLSVRWHAALGLDLPSYT